VGTPQILPEEENDMKPHACRLPASADVGTRARPYRAVALLLPFLASSLWPTLACGEDYLPLWIGNRWEYRGIAGSGETQLVKRMLDVWGSPKFVIDFKASTSNEGLENYWTTDDGDVLLWGWFRELENIGLLYQPGIRKVDPPLYVGKTWNDSIGVFLLPDTLFVGMFTIPHRVHEAGMLTVPAGTFFAFGIGQTNAFLPEFEDYALNGTHLEESERGGATEWYGDGVGKLQYDTDDLYQLVHFVEPTPVHDATWGRIKNAFRFTRK
jgi:hypothetical protein